MPAHFAIAIGFALILAVGFGIVVRLIVDGMRELHENERAMARVVLHNEDVREMEREVAALAAASAKRPTLPIAKPRLISAPTPMLALPPPVERVA